MILAVIILMLLQLLVTYEMAVVMPLAPVIANNYGIDFGIITLLNLGYSFSGLLSSIFGFYADKFGMKRILFYSSILFTCGTFIVYTGSLPAFIIGRFFLGIGYYNIGTIALAYTSILVNEEQLGLISGLYKVAFALGALFAPAIGTWYVKNNIFSDMYLILSIIGMLLSILLLLIPNIKVDFSKNIDFDDVKRVIKKPQTKLMIISIALITIPAVTYYNYASINYNILGFNDVEVSSFYIWTAIGSILAGIIISLLSNRIGKERLSCISTFISGILLIPLIWSNNILLWLGLLFGLNYDTIWGLIYPVSSLFYPGLSATFVTILSTVSSLTNSILNLTTPIVFKIGGFDLLMVISIIALIAASILMNRAFKIQFHK